MPLPRVRLTVRRMMIAVVLIAVPLALIGSLQRRRDRFERLFSYHRGLAGPMYIRTFAPDHPGFATAKARWHYDLSMKYADAARYPWLPVAPDPPEPK